MKLRGILCGAGLATLLKEKAKEQAQQAIKLLAEVREILTEEQRQTASDAILKPAQEGSTGQQPGQQQPPQEQGAAQGPQLDLTEAQKALFQAAAPKPNQGEEESRQKALAEFMGSGDVDALSAPLAPPTNQAQQFRALAKAYASLSQTQRTTMVNYRPPTNAANMGGPQGEDSGPGA